MMQSVLQQALQENHINLSSEAQSKLLHFLALLNKWNNVFNLTAIDNPHDMVYLHLIDSLSMLPFISGKCLDVGSGGGLPGIPLALANPHQPWTLLDKNSKKTRFLTQVVAELSLANVTVVHARCEDFHPAECFDTIISRAFGKLKLFVESTQHLCCATGKWIAMKGKFPKLELTELLQHYAVDSQSLSIKGINAERHIVCLSRKN